MKRVFYNGYILTGDEMMEPQAGLAVVTDDEKITEIAEADKFNLEGDHAGAEFVDLEGGYLMPGLINMHVHIPGSGAPSAQGRDTKKLIKILTSNALMRSIAMSMHKKYAKMELLSGVTTLRSVGGVENFDSRLRDMIAAGKADGPRVLAGDMAVSVPGGHMAGSLAYEANSPEEAAMYVRQIAAGNPDLIKLMITGGVLDAEVKGEPGALKMQPELVKAACDQAKELGLYVAAHVESPEGVRVALENGVTSIEHGALPDDEIVELFKEKNAFLIATLSPALFFSEFSPEVSGVDEVAIYNGKLVFDGIVGCAKKCLEAGIPVGLGTDTGCPYVMHDGMWRELMFFVKYCGVDNRFALYTATKRNAELAGIATETGTIEVGKCADFIVSKGNPLEDLETLRDLKLVVARGRMYRNPKIKHDAVVEREMDKYIR